MKYVVIIYSNDRYGQEGNEILSRLLHQSNICTAANLEVQIGDTSSVTQALAEVTAKLEKVILGNQQNLNQELQMRK